jgi:hypothetical protein
MRFEEGDKVICTIPEKPEYLGKTATVCKSYPSRGRIFVQWDDDSYTSYGEYTAERFEPWDGSSIEQLMLRMGYPRETLSPSVWCTEESETESHQ